MTDERNLAALEGDLIDLVGARGVTRDQRMRERASVDGARMSPVISELLPLGLADIVAYPRSAEEIAGVVALAVSRGVPITPRGKGTGNYGQAIPLGGGLVLDMSRARAIIGIEPGAITAEAGAAMLALEQRALESGQQLWMYPSTVHSSIGGFISGGSGGTGTIAHGLNHQGFVRALDVVHAGEDPTIQHYEGADAQAYVHAYGTSGIIVRATVMLEPAVEWRAVHASLPDFRAALSILRQIGALDPSPRLVSADPPRIAAALPADLAVAEGAASLRAILAPETVEEARALIESAGGVVEAVRSGANASMGLSIVSYNHPIEWLQRTRPGHFFHVEVAGDALIERIDDVLAVVDDGALHIEAAHGAPIGMLAGAYHGPEDVLATLDRLKAIGVNVHNPHQWHVDFEVERTRTTARRTDPRGLLNPGKLLPPVGVVA
jgi:FAD/FMN-containing dehydrogenase